MRVVVQILCLLIVMLGACSRSSKSLRNESGRLEILFLGHNSEHHNSAVLMPVLASQFSLEGISFTYTSNPSDLNAANLGNYDALLIYANHDSITQEQETALFAFVERGGGFVPVHCASWCFRNSEKYIELVGGQFLKHKTDSFTTEIVNRDHPIMAQLTPFATWDETYEHSKIAGDISVLMERVEGEHREPWTWVKEYGKGRVFYTAYGHDERTWSNPGFQALMREGILWAVGDVAKQKWESYRAKLPTLSYRDEEGIPNYEKRTPAPRYQEPLSPEESAKLIQVPVGFDLELFASEPEIINPIAMEWDEKGRLWVVETVDYPNTVMEEKTEGDDRIKICEDTDGDGKADRFTLFADKLNIPTSIVFTNGGIIVSQAPHFLFLKDTDGDDKADVRKTIIDGWGTFDTHAGPSNLKYGFDNHIWGVVGYSGFEGTIAGEDRKFTQGIYRFTPDVSSFEFMTRTSNNTWGLGFTEDNDVFASTANNTHSVFMGIPDKYLTRIIGSPITGSTKIDGHYAMHPVTDKVRQVDVFGGFTAAAGHNFYTARDYPREFWNKIAFVCEPTGHVVHMARIEKNGSGFLEEDSWNLFASADEWVAPVDAKVGPDGAVWVLDWYNFIVQHNPTPTPERGGFIGSNGKGNAYENPLRDKSHGRIWRVVSRQAGKYRPVTLDKERPSDLVDALSSNNLFWRMTAQRLLVERGEIDVLPDLYSLISDKTTDDYADSYSAIHALWTIDGLGAGAKDDRAESITRAALKHSSPGVRKAAIQILSNSYWPADSIIQSGVLNDPDPNTKLSAILALNQLAPSESVGQLLYQMSVEESVKGDEWLAKAVYTAAGQHRKGFLSAFLAANPQYATDKANEVKREVPSYNDAGWQTMVLPQYMEAAGLKIDGIVWFRKEVTLAPAAAGQKATLSLGAVNDSDITFVNGVRVGGIERNSREKRTYEVAAGILKKGNNIIAVRVEDVGGNGGMNGDPAEMFLLTGGRKQSLTGTWKYEVEKETGRRGQSAFEGTTIGKLFADNYLNTIGQSETVTTSSATQIIRIGVIKNEMKYDLTTFTVQAGKPVEIIFENQDFMQHNLLITRIGALETVGKAADKLAADPQGADRQYVPDIPEVLFFTKLVNPQQTVSLKFTAPDKAGDYPFVCTFPGHWSIMNGTMKVVSSRPL